MYHIAGDVIAALAEVGKPGLQRHIVCRFGQPAELLRLMFHERDALPHRRNLIHGLQDKRRRAAKCSYRLTKNYGAGASSIDFRVNGLCSAPIFALSAAPAPAAILVAAAGIDFRRLPLARRRRRVAGAAISLNSGFGAFSSSEISRTSLRRIAAPKSL